MFDKEMGLKRVSFIFILLAFFVSPIQSHAEDPYSKPEYLAFIGCANQCPDQDIYDSPRFQACYDQCKVNFPTGWQIHRDRILGNTNVDLEMKGSNQQTNSSNSNGAGKSITLNVPIAGMTQVNSFGEYFQTWYSFAIGAVGVLATVMIMWGGFKWLTSRGNSGTISESKQIIWSALIGVVLAFLSYTILYLVNPRLTTIGLPTLKTAQINVEESHERCGEVTRTNNGKNIVSNPCPKPVGTYGKDEQTNRTTLTSNGIGIQTNSINTAQINNETIAHMQAFATDAPPKSVTITSGWRDNSENHIQGDTVDIKDNGDIDAFITGIIGTTQGTSNMTEGFEMIIYNAPSNKYGITRILDERKKPGESHWHLEF